MNESTDKSKSPERFNQGGYYKGTEPFLAVFTQTQVVLSGIRLTFDEQIAQVTADLGPQIENARRSFVHSGDIVKALQEIGRVGADFRQRFQSWEAEATRRENDRARQSGEKIAKMKAEHARVRNKAMFGQRAITKLEVELHQLTERDLAPAPAEVVVENEPPQVTPTETEPEIDPAILKANATLIRKRLKLVFDMQSEFKFADMPSDSNPDHRELAIFAKGAFLTIATWVRTERPKPQSFDSDDYSLGRSGAPVSTRHLRFWLLPISKQVLAALKTGGDSVELVADGKGLDQYRFGINVMTVAESNNNSKFPLSKSAEANLLKLEKRFKENDLDFAVGCADLMNLDLPQNEITVSVSED